MSQSDDDRRYLDGMAGQRLAGGCRDCHGHAQVRREPDGEHTLHVWHQCGCPAAAGVIPWAPVRAREDD